MFIISNVTLPVISNGNVEDGVGVIVAVTCGVIPVIEKLKPVLQFGVGVGVGLTGSAVRSISKTTTVADGVGSGSQSQSKYAKKLSWQLEGVGVGVTHGPVVNETDAISGQTE